jgi:hypothetical protein
MRQDDERYCDEDEMASEGEKKERESVCEEVIRRYLTGGRDVYLYKRATAQYYTRKEVAPWLRQATTPCKANAGTRRLVKPPANKSPFRIRNSCRASTF